MSLKRRDVLVAAATVGASAMLPKTSHGAAQSAGLPRNQNLQVLMKGLYLIDLSDTSKKSVKFWFLGGGAHKHAVTLSCDLADLAGYPDDHTVTVDPDGRELATWTLKKRTRLALSPVPKDSMVAYNNSQDEPNVVDDLYWVASVPVVSKVKDSDFQSQSESIVAELTVGDGQIIVLEPSKKRGACTWTFHDVNGGKVTRRVTDQVLFKTTQPADRVTISDGQRTWQFQNKDVRVTLSSMPPAAKDAKKLTHFPHLVGLFKGQVKTPEEATCPDMKVSSPDAKRESGTAYCPPGKRP